MLDFKIIAINELSKLALNQRLNTWLELLEFVCSLPYGRNENRHDLSLVLKEKQGTCSSKHAFLKAIALENNQDNVKLILALYKMNIENTPRIGNILNDYELKYIPEAHCYLKINDTRLDVTSANSNFEKIRASLIKEIEIEPYQVSEYKVDYHKKFIEQWIKDNGIKYSLNEIWAIREKCIKNIENSN